MLQIICWNNSLIGLSIHWLGYRFEYKLLLEIGIHFLFFKLYLCTEGFTSFVSNHLFSLFLALFSLTNHLFLLVQLSSIHCWAHIIFISFRNSLVNPCLHKNSLYDGRVWICDLHWFYEQHGSLQLWDCSNVAL